MVSEAPDTNRPASLGDYQLVRRIAVGGMAEIFEARCLREDAPAPRVVLKVLLPQYASDAQFLRMLEDEAKVGMLLSHPNLVRMHEVGHAGARHFLVMDLVDGIALSDLIRSFHQRDQRVPVKVLGFVIDQVLEALAYVHEVTDEQDKPLQIVHRDVTPHNVLLSREGQVRLGDFGIARSNVRDARTRTGVIKGKLRYLAPEQVTGSAIDARTDLYAVGLMLFEMLTGERYLEGETEIELLRAAEAPEFRAPSSVADVDPRFDPVLRRALERFPEERYLDARAFGGALRKVVDALGTRGGPEQLAPFVSQVCGELPVHDAPIVLVGEDGVSGPVATSAALAGEPRRSCPTVDLRPRRVRATGGEEPTAAVAGRDDLSLADTRTSWPKYTMAAAGVAALLAATLWLRGWQTQDSESSLASVEAPDSGPTATDAPDSAVVDAEQARLADEVETGPPQHDGSPSAATSGRPGTQTKGNTTVAPSISTTAAATTVAAVAAVAAVASAPDPDAKSAALKEEGLKNRLAAARSSLRSRGILNSDLSTETRGLLSRAGSELAADRWEEASSTLDAVEREVAAVRVDGPFVQRKMARVDQAVQAASRAGVDVSGLQPLSARALQAYMEGRYAETNRLLNDLLGKLAAAKAR